jgi:hypothetical protein
VTVVDPEGGLPPFSPSLPRRGEREGGQYAPPQPPLPLHPIWGRRVEEVRGEMWLAGIPGARETRLTPSKETCRQSAGFPSRQQIYTPTFLTHILHILPKIFMGVFHIRQNSLCTFSIYSKICYANTETNLWKIVYLSNFLENFWVHKGFDFVMEIFIIQN